MSRITKEMTKFYVPKLEDSNQYIEYYTDLYFRLFNNEVSVQELRDELIDMWNDKEKDELIDMCFNKENE